MANQNSQLIRPYGEKVLPYKSNFYLEKDEYIEYLLLQSSTYHQTFVSFNFNQMVSSK